MQTKANRRHRVLYLDGDDYYAKLVQESREQNKREDLEIVRVAHLDSALERLCDPTFDAVLTDPWQVDDDGLGNCLQLMVATRDVPIVVIAGEDDDGAALQAIDAGAQDFLVKGEADGEAIFRAVRFAIERFRFTQSQTAWWQPASGREPQVLLISPEASEDCQIGECVRSAFGPGCQVVRVGLLSDALRELGVSEFELTVVDLAIPDSRGIETCADLYRQSPGLPMIVYADSDDEALAVNTIRHGASDYLVKGQTSPRQLTRSICFAIHRQRRMHLVATRQVAGTAGLSECPPAPALATNADSDGLPSLAPISKDGRPRRLPSNNRRHGRYSQVRSVLAIPIVSGRLPDWKNRMAGFTSDIAREGLGLELDGSQLESPSLIVGVERRDGVLCYAGLEVRHVTQVAARRLSVGGHIGGWGQEILDPANLAASFDGETKSLVRRVSDEVLAAWCRVDVLRPVLLDRVSVCPRCRALPTFRRGCRSCGSGRISGGRLIHHFACAYVGPVPEFEQADEVVCPKCRARQLIVGTDFEYQSGLVHCQDCHWSGTDPEQVGQCLRCSFRFPGAEARDVEVMGYHVHRLDPLAFISAP